VVISSTQLPHGSVGVPYSATVLATGGKTPYTWSVAPGTLPPGLQLDAASGAISGVPSQAGSFPVFLQVTDAFSKSNAASFLSDVTGAVEIVTASPLPAVTAGSYVTQSLAATGGVQPYCWQVVSGLPPGLAHATCASVVSGTPASPGKYLLQMKVQDSAPAPGNSASKDFVWVVNAAPEISTLELPDGQVAVKYSATLQGAGGQPPYSWSLAGGGLPAGLQLDAASGTIAGTPSQAGVYSFTARLTDSTGASATRSLSIKINPQELAIVTSTAAGGQAGVAYSLQFQAQGGTGVYQWKTLSGSLPPGLTLSASGLLSGTPSQAGAFQFELEVQSGGAARTRGFSITISKAALSIVTKALPDAVVGAYYSQAVQATGGSAPYTWRLAQGALPAGISLTPPNIAGTPNSAGSSSFVLQVTDADGATATAALSLTVVSPLKLQAPDDAQGVISYFLHIEVTASGGTQPYKWTSTATSLPPGLVIENNVLYGTPAAAGTFPVSFQVQDAGGQTASAGFNLVVASPLSLVTSSVGAAVAGTSYSFLFVAQGGKPAYNWKLDGKLPQGLTFANGVLAGAASEIGKFSFTVTVTDQTSTAKSRYFTMDVAPPGLPPLNITGGPQQTPGGSQQPVTLELTTTYPFTLTGTLELTFIPDQGLDDPAVQFSTGGRVATFTVPAGSTQAAFTVPQLRYQTGTVAGTIRIKATFRANGVDVTPSPAPEQVVRVLHGPPVITAVRATRSGAVLTLVISGYSTPRDMVSGTFTFTAAAGSNYQGGPIAVQLGSTFQNWYAGAQSAAYGSQFELTVPFTVSGAGASVLSGVSLTLTNSVGKPAVPNMTF